MPEWFDKIKDSAAKEWEANGASQLREIRDASDIGVASIIRVPDCDICTNYRWAINGVDQKYINEVPMIRLTEYQSNSGPIAENMEWLKKTVVRAGATIGKGVKNVGDGAGQGKDPSDPTMNPYMNMYRGVATGNVFQLPFFSPYNHTLNNSWSAVAGNAIQDTVNKAIETAGSLFQKGKIEQRKTWTGASAASYNFSFTLYNTFSVDDIAKNLLFVRALINNNLAIRTSFATLLPPCFYKIEIPGVRYAPMAVLGGIDIQNVGQVNRTPMSLPTGDGSFTSMDVNIPDAWSISITVNELLNETRNLLGSVYQAEDKKITVINSSKGIDGQNLKYQDVGGGGISR